MPAEFPHGTAQWSIRQLGQFRQLFGSKKMFAEPNSAVFGSRALPAEDGVARDVYLAKTRLAEFCLGQRNC